MGFRLHQTKRTYKNPQDTDEIAADPITHPSFPRLLSDYQPFSYQKKFIAQTLINDQHLKETDFYITLSCRPEKLKRGGVYYYAYWRDTRVRPSKLRKKYLGKPELITAEKLDIIAQIFFDAVPQPKILKVQLWLRVENNSKFVRGKGRVRAEIEDYLSHYFQMEKPAKDSWEYVLYIPYTTDEELEITIYRDIYREMDSMADLRNCFIEADVVALDDSERSW